MKIHANTSLTTTNYQYEIVPINATAIGSSCICNQKEGSISLKVIGTSKLQLLIGNRYTVRYRLKGVNNEVFESYFYSNNYLNQLENECLLLFCCLSHI